MAARVVCLLKVAILLLAFDPLAADAFTLPKSQLSHLLGLVLAALIVWLLLVRRPWPFRLSPLHYATGALLVAFVLATPGALDMQVAFFGADRRYLGLTQALDSTVLFVAVAYLFRTTRDLLLLVGSVGVLAAGVAMYALAQRLGADPIHFTESTIRPISSLGQPDFLAPFACVVSATCIAALVLTPQLRNIKAAIPILVLAGLCLYIAYAAGTRSSILALAGAAVATLTLAGRSGLGPRQIGAAVTIFAVAVAALLASPLGSRVTPAALEADRTVAGRMEIWTTALRMNEGRLLLGVGPDNFAVGYPKFRAEISVDLNGVDALQNNPHNWLLFAYTSAGLLGAVAALILAIAPLPLGLRLARNGHPAALAIVPLYGYLAQGLVNVNDIGIDWIQWVSLGVIAGGTIGAPSDRSTIPNEASRTAGWLLAGALIVAAAISMGPAGQTIRASEDIAASQSLISAKRGLEAVQSAAEAARFDSARGHSWGAFGSALSAVGSANAAQVAFADASKREPWQPLWWRDAAFQALAQNDEGGAFALLQKAVAADPMDVTSLDLLSRLAFNRNNLEPALAYGSRAVRLRPASIPLYDAPVRAAIQLQRFDDAKALLVPAVEQTNDPHLRVLLAQVLLDSGDKSAAKAQIDAALRVAPNDPEVLAAAKALEGP